jgi:TonB family protein
MRRVLLFIILSICFHFLSWNTSQYLSLFIDKPQTQIYHRDPIEVSLQEKPENSTANQIVRQADPPKELENKLESNEKTELFSERKQRVKIQSKAALFGLTKNRFYNAQKKSKERTERLAKEKLRPTKDKNSILGDLKQRETRDTSNNEAFLNAPSTIGEMLPDSIKTGEITALNTDRHLFYSFYTRVEEAIRYKWEHDVEVTISNLNRNQYYNPKSTWSTRLDILLTKEGKFHRAVLLKESGIRGLDLAAVNAFRDANFFPHPPKEMVGDDGFIRMQYQFHVFFDPSHPPRRLNL